MNDVDRTYRQLIEIARNHDLQEGIAEAATGSPRTILKSAYRYFDFIDEQTWLHMLQDRNAIAHVYDGEALTRLLSAILKSYIPAFLKLADDVADRYGSELERIP